jgi:LPPG:FO 2-phospho-L-lactate transferase
MGKSNHVQKLKVTALAGGVGGARLAHGLAQALNDDHLTVVVNIGDDFDHFGLKICPDLDTVCYTLAGLENPSMGWGRANETRRALDTIQTLGGPTWFLLGDADLGVHLERTRRLRQGQTLSDITRHFCHSWQIKAQVLPVSDDLVPTLVHTPDGVLGFQDYFVGRRCEPKVNGFTFSGADAAIPAPGVLQALAEADLIVICPSNPWVSVDPILAVAGVRDVLRQRPVLAVSPIIGGQTVKGPAAKMFSELGFSPSALSVAHHYGSRSEDGLLTGFVMDSVDESLVETLQASGLSVFATNTIMKNPQDRLRLAGELLQFSQTFKQPVN